MRRLTSLFVAVSLFACSEKKSAEQEPSSKPAESTETPSAQEARALFETLCSTCHGKDGRGDGPAAASLDPKPRNYTDKAWQASVTDAQLKTIIVNGGAAVGKSVAMPANPQLRDKPQVVDELVKIVRSFGQ